MINDRELTMEDMKNFFELLNTIDGTANKDKDKEDELLLEDYENDDDDLTEEDIVDFFKFLSTMAKDIDKDSSCYCDNCNENDDFKVGESCDSDNNLVHSFMQMIEEFENGYEGYFTDGENVYGYNSGTLLNVFPNVVFRSDITSDMLSRLYIKTDTETKTEIDNDNVLAHVLDGDIVNFTLDDNGIKATGSLSYKNGLPSYKIDNKTCMNNSDLILMALFKGKWTL